VESRGSTTQEVVYVQTEDEVFFRDDVTLVVEIPGIASIQGEGVEVDTSSEIDAVVLYFGVKAKVEHQETHPFVHSKTFRRSEVKQHWVAAVYPCPEKRVVFLLA